MMLLVVWLLVHGPQPRRFTKWGWFWLIAVLPAGIGAVWYLLREAPWGARASAWPALGPRQTRNPHDANGPVRRGGWLALLFAVVLAQPAGGLLQGGLDEMTDHHPGPPTSWVVVDQQGKVVHGTGG